MTTSLAILEAMTYEEVRKSVVAFLDQFISRGAATDVVATRDGLSDDPVTRQRLTDQLTSREPSIREAYDAMRAFFEVEFASRGAKPSTSPAGLVLLISWTAWEPDGGTSDPAQWHDWLAAVKASSAS
jgi:hypothetical protein